jgi:hypothetical protein
MKAAAAAILLQTDEVVTKPMLPDILVQIIRDRLKREIPKPRPIESVATILARETRSTIDAWLTRVDQEGDVLSIPMAHAESSAYLPQLFLDLVSRLQQPVTLGTRALVSRSAAKHGILRREQGYTPAMMVEESRMLQVSIFETLERNLTSVEFTRVLEQTGIQRGYTHPVDSNSRSHQLEKHLAVVRYVCGAAVFRRGHTGYWEVGLLVAEAARKLRALHTALGAFGTCDLAGCGGARKLFRHFPSLKYRTATAAGSPIRLSRFTRKAWPRAISRASRIDSDVQP